MSLKGEALKAVVVERLTAAADEIFGLFERTLVEYKAEILQSKLLQRPHVVLYRHDIPTFSSGINTKPTEIKREDTALTIPLPSVKIEEPGCSSDLFLQNKKQNGKGLGTGNLSDGALTRSRKYAGKNLLGHRKDSVAVNDQRHRLFPKLNFIYRCQICGMKFTNQDSLVRHVRRVHDKEKPHTCPICQKGFFQRWEYGIHMRTHTGERPFNCSDCGRSFKINRALKDHKCSPDHRPQLSPSLEEDVPSTSTMAADVRAVVAGADGDPEPSHIKQEEKSPVPVQKNSLNVGTYRCSVCGKKFTQRHRLIRHIRQVHYKERPHRCPICQKGFYQKFDYDVHMRIHTGEKPFSCSLCGKAYISKSSLSGHKCSPSMEPHHYPSPWREGLPSSSEKDLFDIQTVIVGADGDPVPATVKQEEDSPSITQLSSGKTEDKLTLQKTKKRQDSFVKQCEVKEPSCSADDNNQQVNSHLDTDKSSTGLKDESLPTYDEHMLRAGQKNATSDHPRLRCQLRKRRPPVPKRCLVCGKRFSEAKSLSRHVRQVHMQETQHTCSICQKGFFRKDTYNNHMRMHTGERPFSCTVCGKGYTCKHSLNGHRCSQRQSVDRPQSHSAPEENVRAASERYVFDVQTVSTTADIAPESTEVIKEEHSILKKTLLSVKTEENMNSSNLQKGSAEENSHGLFVEEPGCSVDLHLEANEQLVGGLDSDNSHDWESIDKSSTENKRQDIEVGQSKTSEAAGVRSSDRLQGCARSRNFKSVEKNLKNTGQQLVGPGPYTCQICSRVYRHRKSFRSHLKIHLNRFCCFICQRVFSYSSQLRDHMKVHTGEKPFVCKICESKFRRNSDLLKHMRIKHDGERHYTCSFCQKGFFQKYDYVTHLRIHTGEKPFRCSVCSRSFTTKQSLLAHICLGKQSRDHEPVHENHPSSERELLDIQAITVRSDRPSTTVKTEENVNKSSLYKDPEEKSMEYVVNNCEGEEPGCSVDLYLDNDDQVSSCSDTDNSSDWDVMEKNTKEELDESSSKNNIISTDQPHRCSQCSKTFDSHTKLRKHLRHHAGEGSFPCQVCNRVYSHKYTYNLHMKKHSQNPIRCAICHRIFDKPYTLKKHMTVHTGEKPYSCPVCGKKFRLQTAQKRHYYRIHAKKAVHLTGSLKGLC